MLKEIAKVDSARVRNRMVGILDYYTFNADV
jgi:hypothetical protein